MEHEIPPDSSFDEWMADNRARFVNAFNWHRNDHGMSEEEAHAAARVDMLDLHDHETRAPDACRQPIMSDREERWESVVDAATALKVNPSTISEAMRGKRRCRLAGDRLFWRVGHRRPTLEGVQS